MSKITRRTEARLDVEVPARVSTFGGKGSAMLCDLSLSGARVKTDCVLSIGSEVSLNWLEYEMVGRVMWTVSDQAGIRFSRALENGVLEDTRVQMENNNFQTDSDAGTLAQQGFATRHG